MARPGMKYCVNCGQEIDEKAEICPKCGVRVKPPPRARYYVVKEGGKNQVLAGLLAIFLGGIGVHKFYLGRIGMGIVYVLFCWTGVPEVLGIIEGIIYLTMEPEDFSAKYDRF